MEKKILPNVLRLGLPIPKAFAEAPTLSYGLELYLDAYCALSSTRGGMGDGPIPWTAAMQYCEHIGFEGEDADELWYYITEMDQAWHTFQEAKRAKSKS